MLYHASPLFTLASLAVLFGVFYSAKCFFDSRMAALEQQHGDPERTTGSLNS